MVGASGSLDGGGGTLSAEIAVLQLPGSNCERETVRAVEAAGGSASIVRWNEPVERLERCAAFVIPGGFSFQDRIRAGAVAARLPVLDLIVRRAAEGTPVLGICNGAQVLVESGVVPGISPGKLELVLAPNRMPGRNGYYARWVFLGGGPAAERCLFTRGLGDQLLPVPIAHAEGRFATRDEAVARQLPSYIALAYRTPEGEPADAFPWNPNGSLHAAAGITNEAGNVLALMPHPERAAIAAQVPAAIRAGAADGDGANEEAEAAGPGLLLFRNLVEAVGGSR